MSIQTKTLKTGEKVYLVRWRAGSKMQAKTFRGEGARNAAKVFDAEIVRKKSQGELASLKASRERLDEYVEGVWMKSYAVDLKSSTRDFHAALWGKHIGPYLGERRFDQLSTEEIRLWRADRLTEGSGRHSVYRAQQLLGSILERAVEDGRLSTNPARKIKNPKPRARMEVRPLVPREVEILRWHLGRRDDALVCVLAYAGLRPSEAYFLRWRDVRENTLHVYASKTDRWRTVPIRPEVRKTLVEWKLRSKYSGDADLVFPNAKGAPVGKEGHANFRSRKFDPAVEAAGLDEIEPKVTPYTLRHSCASLLLHEGRNVIEVARWMGHDATETLRTYGHVMDELVGQGHVSGDELIEDAQLVPSAA